MAEGKSILVVIPSNEARDPICKSLEDRGYRVLRLADPMSALERLATRELPDLVVLDIDGLAADGDEILRFWRRETQAPRVRTLVLTSRTAPPVADGAMRFLNKPCSAERLLEEVQLVLTLN